MRASRLYFTVRLTVRERVVVLEKKLAKGERKGRARMNGEN